MEQYAPYAAVILAVILFFNQTKQFTKPEDLEKKHREILDDCEKKFVQLSVFNEFKKSIDDLKDKVDKIYDHIMKEV